MMCLINLASPPGRSSSTAGMVLGIIAWGVALISFGLLSPISFVLSCVGLPLAWVGHNQAKRVGAPTGSAVAGIALNGLGLGLAVLLFVLVMTSRAASTL